MIVSVSEVCAEDNINKMCLAFGAETDDISDHIHLVIV